MRRAAAVAALLLLARRAPAAERQVARGRGGAVAAAEEKAARVGIEILKRGGNAADAAVAVGFALAVTWPEAGNIGGGGFWISRDARGQVARRSTSGRSPRGPRGATSSPGPAPDGIAPLRPRGLWPRASRAPSHGLCPRPPPRPAACPGRRSSTPAVRLARDGFVDDRDGLALDRDPEVPRSAWRRTPRPPHLPARRRAARARGRSSASRTLARTLEAIRDRGEDGFYRGRVAREIEDGQKRVGGLITRGDLALYAAKIRSPLRFQFGGAEIVTTARALFGSRAGGDGAARALRRVSRSSKGRDAASAHLLAEIEKRAFRDRNRYLGDPAFPRRPPDPLHRPGAAQAARGVDRPAPRDAARRARRSARTRSPRRRTSRSWTRRAAPSR